MKAGIAQNLLGISRTTLLSKVKEFNLEIEKTKSGDNIFKWSDIISIYSKINDIKLKPFVMSITQNKGGVGKTTSSINLAYLFSQLGKTLLIDLDGQANLSQVFQVYKRDKKDITLKEALEDPKKTPETIVNVGLNLDLIPNVTAFDLWKKQAITKRYPQYLLKKAIKEVQHDYKFIIIDCPPSIDLSFELSLCASDYALVILDGHPFSLEGLENILSEIQRIIDDDITGMLDLKVLGVFFARYKETILTKEIYQETLKSYSEQKIFNTKIRDNIQIPESQAQKLPIFEYSDSCNASLDYFYLWTEILERIKE